MGEPAPEGTRGQTSEYVQRYMTQGFFDKINIVGQFTQDREHTISELAHAWLLAKPAVSSVISGATKVEHVLENSQAARWELSTLDYQAVCDILQN
jgi:aryl-alcohol dehydrogenase-like predicted oxidoreductase